MQIVFFFMQSFLRGFFYFILRKTNLSKSQMFWWDSKKKRIQKCSMNIFFGNHSSRIKFDYNVHILKNIIYSNSYVWNVLIDCRFDFSLVIFIVVVSDFVNQFFQVLFIVLLVGPIFWRIKKLFIDSLDFFWHFQIKILKLESLHVIKFPSFMALIILTESSVAILFPILCLPPVHLN